MFHFTIHQEVHGSHTDLALRFLLRVNWISHLVVLLYKPRLDLISVDETV